MYRDIMDIFSYNSNPCAYFQLCDYLQYHALLSFWKDKFVGNAMLKHLYKRKLERICTPFLDLFPSWIEAPKSWLIIPTNFKWHEHVRIRSCTFDFLLISWMLTSFFHIVWFFRFSKRFLDLFFVIAVSNLFLDSSRFVCRGKRVILRDFRVEPHTRPCYQ